MHTRPLLTGKKMSVDSAKLAIQQAEVIAPRDLATLAPVASIAPLNATAKLPEVKAPYQSDIAHDDDLSEFERARRTSKTWSMGQD